MQVLAYNTVPFVLETFIVIIVGKTIETLSLNINNNRFPDMLFIRTFKKRGPGVDFEKNVGGGGGGGCVVELVSCSIGIRSRCGDSCHPVEEEEAAFMGKWSVHHTKNPEEEKCLSPSSLFLSCSESSALLVNN